MTPTRIVISGFAVVAVFAAWSVTPTLAKSAPTTRGGVYSAEQAQQGKAIYDGKCAMCHGPALKGNGPFPPLAGDAFLTKWNGKTLADLDLKIQTTMPTTEPGTLTPDDTARLVAYILSTNTFPAGEELPKDAEALKAILIENTPPQ